MKKHKAINIVGDQTIDWTLEVSDAVKSSDPDDQLKSRVTVRWMPGGIFLVKGYVDHLTKGRKARIRSAAPREPLIGHLRPFRNPYQHSFLVINSNSAQQAADRPPKVRVQDNLGFGRGANPRRIREPKKLRSLTLKHPARRASVIVVNDSNTDFRKTPSAWPAVITNSHQRHRVQPHPWILLKMSHDVAAGELWERVLSRLRQPDDWLSSRLVLLTTASRLRDAGAAISRDMSWEQCIEDVVRETEQGGKLAELAACRYLLVSFGPSGLILVERRAESPARISLACHRKFMEQSWTAKHSGQMFGYMSAVAAIMAVALAESDDGESALPKCLPDALHAMQSIWEEGFKPDAVDRMPFIQVNASAKVPLVSAQGILEPDRGDKLSILKSQLPEPDIRALAREVATGGEEALSQCAPIGQFGKLIVVERNEIEQMRIVQNAITNYQKSATLSAHPLALAVFGKPGSGKSYAVKQLTTHPKLEFIPFNLSQFDSPRDLVGALHKIRDLALSGKIPVAFWDEFDTTLESVHLGWLRYFLAPIQDGSFREAETVHRIGTSIFVFAGGTADTYEQFSSNAMEATELKGPDFVSRLQGFVNVSGPEGDPTRDPQVALRRALIFNAMLRREDIVPIGMRTSVHSPPRDELDIKKTVIDAFLYADGYQHGTRSMEAIIRMSRLREGQPFSASDLPSRSQLAMHLADVGKFLDIAHGVQAGH
ncbi:hypothetical protein ACWEQL_02270 [Kitasatospora sp. NPDC004240]